MGNENHTDNRLFLVCPFCQMENFIVNHYGSVFFLTAPAAIFHFMPEEAEAVKEFMARENITRVYLAAETSCSFTQNALANFNHSGLRCETEIQKLKSPEDTLCSLTKKLVTQEASRLEKLFSIGGTMPSATPKLHALQTYKNQNKIVEIK